MSILEVKYDYNTQGISLTSGQSGQKALQASYNTVTKKLSANLFDLQTTNIVEKYGQIG